MTKWEAIGMNVCSLRWNDNQASRIPGRWNDKPETFH